jgi:hypothetical protein
MERMIRPRYVCSLGMAACLTILACVHVRSLTQPTGVAVAPNSGGTESDINFIYETHEPVGWVFGRVVGFKGADKPLLPPQTLPAPNSMMLRPSLSP